MPRLPVDGKKVQEFRVTLGTFERERLDTLITGLTVKNVASPIVELISDVSAMSFLFTAYISYVYGPDVVDLIQGDYENVGLIYSDYQKIKASGLIIQNAIPFGLGFLPNMFIDAYNIIQGQKEDNYNSPGSGAI